MSSAAPDIPSNDDQDRWTIRYSPLLLVLIAACVGICSDRFIAPPVWGWGVLLIASAVAWDRMRRARDIRAASLCLLVAVASAAGLWHHLRWHVSPVDHVAAYATRDGAEVQLEGLVTDEPRVIPAAPFDPMRVIPTEDRTALTVRAERIRVGAVWREVSGDTPVYVRGHLLGVHSQDRVRILGRLRGASEAANPGAFDYALYARADGERTVVSVSYPDSVERIEEGGALSPVGWLDSIRASGVDVLQSRLQEDNAALAAAMLLGERDLLDYDTREAFRLTGTAHMLAISGLHVMLAAGAVWAVARVLMLSPRQTAVTLAVSIVLYAALTGGRPPVVRAAILTLIYCLGLYIGRRSVSVNALAAAGLCVLAWNPAELFRPGAQLSFLAVAAILGAGYWAIDRSDERVQSDEPEAKKAVRKKGRLSRVLEWTREAVRIACMALGRSLFEAARVTVIVWLVTLPLTLYTFHVVTPVGVLLNPLAWIPLTVGLVSGFVVLLTAWLLPPVAWGAAGVCDVSFTCLREMVLWTERLPLGHVHAPGPSLWWVIGFYAMLGAWVVIPMKRKRRRGLIGAIAAWTVVGLGVSLAADVSSSRGLELTVLSVGHGQAMILRLPDGRTLLVDAGQMGSPHAASRTVCDALLAMGVTRVDAAILSHADADHFNALPGVLDRMPVGAVYASEQMLSSDSASVRALLEMLERQEVSVHAIHAGKHLASPGSRNEDDCRIDVLHPPPGESFQEDNAASVSLLIRFEDHNVLLLGDLEPPGLDDVLETAIDGPCVLVAPHHGSSASRPELLCRWCRPEVVIISGGSQDRSPEAMAVYNRYAPNVFHTGDSGAVAVRLEGGRLTVDAYCVK